MAHTPKIHEEGALKAGDRVFYCGSPYWVLYAPTTWDKGYYVRICSSRLRPGMWEADEVPKDAVTFCIHADCLKIAPQARNPFSRQPTEAAVRRSELTKQGIKDVGDEVAALLRSCKDLPAMYACAARYLGTPETELKAKYGKLNHGQQRMNLGNRMRNHFKKHGGKKWPTR